MIRFDRHAALVCLCGRAIYSVLRAKLDENRRLGFSTWLDFVINFMEDRMLNYVTFQKMVNSLIEAKPAVNLLRSIFLGSYDFVTIYDSGENKLAKFLTAEGVLVR